MTDVASRRDKDLAKLIKILSGLALREIEALNRFYVQGQEIAQIASDLGVDICHVQKLKSQVKQAYSALQKPN